MKKILMPILCLVFLTGTALYCQNSSVKWISSPEDEYFSDIISLQDEKAYFINIIRGEFETNPDLYSVFTKYRNIIYKADQELNISDSITIDHLHHHEILVWKTILAIPDTIMMLASALDTATGDFQACLIWLDGNLNILKDSLYGLPDRSEFGGQSIINSNGNIVIAGEIDPVVYSDRPSFCRDSFVHFFWEFDLVGNEVRYKQDTLGSPFGLLVELPGKQKYHNVANNIYELDYEFNLDTMYNYSWPNFTMFGVKEYVNDKYFIFGLYDIPDPQLWDTDMAYLLMDGNDNILGMNHYGIEDTLDCFGGIDFINEDTIYFGGIKNWKTGNNDSWLSLYKTNTEGDIFMETYFGGYGKYTSNRVLATSDGGCIMAGSWWDFYNFQGQNTQHDVVIMKTDANGMIAGMEGNNKFRISETLLYPNPFSDGIYIETGRHEQTELLIFDITGRKVVEMSNLTNGRIDLSHLTDGVYIYMLRTGSGYLDKGKIIKRQ